MHLQSTVILRVDVLWCLIYNGQSIRPVQSHARAEGHNILGTEAPREILNRCITPHENSGMDGSIARCDSPFWSSWAQPLRSKFEIWGRNLEARTMRQLRCVWNGKQHSQAQRNGQSCIPLAFGCLVSTSTLLIETKGKKISGLRCTCWAVKIWIQQNWRLFEYIETRERFSQPLETCKQMRKQQCASNASNSVAWKTRPKPRIPLWVDQWPKSTSC